MSRYLIRPIYILILIMSLYFYDKKVEEFTVNKNNYIQSVVLSLLSIMFIKYFKPDFGVYHSIIYHYIISFLIILTITDIKYYEIDGFSYYFIIGPIVFWLLIRLSLGVVIASLSSFAITSLILFTLEKANYLILKKGNPKVKEEEVGLGGADIKLLLLLSIMIKPKLIFMFLMATMFFGMIYYLVRAIISNDFKNQKIPLILGITIAFILVATM